VPPNALVEPPLDEVPPLDEPPLDEVPPLDEPPLEEVPAVPSEPAEPASAPPAPGTTGEESEAVAQALGMRAAKVSKNSGGKGLIGSLNLARGEPNVELVPDFRPSPIYAACACLERAIQAQLF
jgi:hypothetical protein